MYLMGLDIGTSGCKCILVDPNDRVVFESVSEYNIISNKSGEYVLNTNEVWESICGVIKICSSRIKKTSSLAIAAASCGESFVMLNKDEKNLPEAFLCSDQRGSRQLQELLSEISMDKIMQLTGIPAHEMYSLVKLMWMRENQKNTYEKVRYILQFQDYFNFKMTGQHVTDYSLAARTMAFNLKKQNWDDEILNFAKIDKNIFPNAVPSGTLIGKASTTVIKELGLPTETFLYTGGHDQTLTALGTGVINKGIAVDGMGSSECIAAVLSAPQQNTAMLNGHYNCGYHALKDKYLSLGFTFSAGTLVKWFSNNFARGYRNKASLMGKNLYQYLDANVSKKPTTILVLPHFNGSGTPSMDVHSKGAFVGLDISHDMGDVYKSILEGITYEMMLNIESMRNADIQIETLRAVGGGASSKTWLQIKADIYNMPIEKVKYKEAASLGAVICAGVGAGVYSDMQEGISRLVEIEGQYEPNIENNKIYLENYNRYKQLYPSVKEIMI